MVKPQHLPNAPITEALIDLRVNKSDAQALEQSLGLLKERLGDRYPQVNNLRGFEAGFVLRMGKDVEPHARDKGFGGYIFYSQDGLNVVQFRPDGFTYNRLKPYTSWEEITPRALDLWRLYTELTKPEFVVRAALRYINHLRFPFPLESYYQYLTTMPPAPEGPHYFIKGYLSRVIIGDPNLGTDAIVSQALEPLADTKSITFILDIDAFREGEFAPLGDELLRTLDNLRAMKNNIFFGSITEDTLRILNGS